MHSSLISRSENDYIVYRDRRIIEAGPNVSDCSLEAQKRMSRWLKVTEGLFRGRVNDPAPFEIHCVCGRKVTGLRTKAAQAQTCPVCQTRLFVLPVSVYPQPRTPPRKPATVRPTSAPGSLSDEIEAGAVEPASGKRGAAKARPAARSGSPSSSRTPPDAERKAEAQRSTPRRSDSAVAHDVAGGVDLERLRRKLLSPVRLVLAGVALVVGLVALWSWHLSTLGQAERTVAAATKQAELALKENNIEEAARQFQQVKLSLDVLGRTDSRARALRQTAFELEAAANLANASLVEILHEAGLADPDSWPAKFRTNYRDQWVVIDAMVSRVDDSALGNAAKGYRYDVDFRLAEGLNQAVIIADLPAFNQVIPQGGEPLRVIFAAQLDESAADPHRENTWRIVLRPASGFLWSSPQNLEFLGVAADDETTQLLAEQSTRLGITP